MAQYGNILQCRCNSNFCGGKHIQNCNGAVYLVQTTHASGNSFQTYIPPVCLVVSTRHRLRWRFMEVPGPKMRLIRQKEAW